MGLLFFHFNKYFIRSIINISGTITSNSFSFKNHTLKNDSDIKIAEIEVYSTDKYLKNELNVIIKKSLYEILISSLIIVTLLFFIIKTFVLKPIHNIIKVIQDDCEEGLPKNIIPSNNTKELNELASKMNEMIATIKTSRLKIKEINAYSKSRKNFDDKRALLWAFLVFIE